MASISSHSSGSHVTKQELYEMLFEEGAPSRSDPAAANLHDPRHWSASERQGSASTRSTTMDGSWGADCGAGHVLDESVPVAAQLQHTKLQVAADVQSAVITAVQRERQRAERERTEAIRLLTEGHDSALAAWRKERADILAKADKARAKAVAETLTACRAKHSEELRKALEVRDRDAERDLRAAVLSERRQRETKVSQVCASMAKERLKAVQEAVEEERAAFSKEFRMTKGLLSRELRTVENAVRARVRFACCSESTCHLTRAVLSMLTERASAPRCRARGKEGRPR